MNREEIVEKIRERLAENIIDISSPSPRRIFILARTERLIEIIKILKEEFGFSHLSTITGVDRTTDFEILYHLADNFFALTVRVQIGRENPEIQSVCEIIPGAVLYEREIQDMFGIKVKGIPDPRPLILPDDWPENSDPLRKDWSYQPPEEKIPGEKQ
ncbi:MAG: NADH-quinone oxidoreductase subunit C [bacterium]|nr:NADH-quinone oxidoreductase subunit C [bacterium]